MISLYFLPTVLVVSIQNSNSEYLFMPEMCVFILSRLFTLLPSLLFPSLHLSSPLVSPSFPLFSLPRVVQQNQPHPTKKRYKEERPFVWVMGFNYPSTNILTDVLFIELCVNNALTPFSKVQCFIHYYIYSELENYHKAVHTNFPSGCV